MTRMYEPDGLLASVLATLSFDDTVVIFNGPCGCYNMIAGTANRLIPKRRDSAVDNRMECDYIEDEDFIMGTVSKVNRALDSMRDAPYEMVAVIDSPGVSVTGDVNWRYGSRNGSATLHMESLLNIKDFAEGYDVAMSQIVGVYDGYKGGESDMPSVNLLGCCPSFIGWRESVAELRSLLELVGVKVCSTPGCGGSFKGLGDMYQADISVSVVPEYCLRTCEEIAKGGGPGVFRPSSVPVGFSGTETWISEVCSELGVRPDNALDLIGRSRRDASAIIRSAYHKDGFESRPFSVRLAASISDCLASWLEDYLGMVRSDNNPEIAYGTGYSERDSDDPVLRRGTVVLEHPMPPRTFFLPRQAFGCRGASFILEETFARYRSQPPVDVRQGCVSHHVRAVGELDYLPSDAVDVLKHLLTDHLAGRANRVDLAGRPKDYHLVRVLRGDVQVVAYHYHHPA